MQWLAFLLKRCMDAAQSGQVSRPIRILCIILISLVSLIIISSLALLIFVIERQSLFKRGIFLIMEILALASYLQFLHAIVRKGGKKP